MIVTLTIHLNASLMFTSQTIILTIIEQLSVIQTQGMEFVKEKTIK